MQDLMMETVSESNFTEKERIKDLLNFISSANERSLIQNGHVLAMSNAGAQINNIASTSDIVSGIGFITNTGYLAKNIERNENLEKYIDILQSIKSKINLQPLHTFTATSLEMEKSQLIHHFETKENNLNLQNLLNIQEDKIGWITGAQVCYCAEAFPTVDMEHEDAPALTVLGAVLRNGYLHSAIREKGGAYGAGASQDSKNKIFKFFSYRDPKCSETFDEFAKSREWSLKNITAAQLDEGVLGVISGIDKPLSPYGEAMNDFLANIDNKDINMRLNFRSKVKDCSLDDLVNVSRKYLFNESRQSIIAGENYIDEIKNLGFKIKNI